MENNTNDPSSTESEQNQQDVKQPLHTVVVLEPLVLEPPHMMFDRQPCVFGYRGDKKGRGGGFGRGGFGRGGFGGDDDDDNPRGPKPDKVDKKLTLSNVGGLKEHVDYLKQAVIYPLMHKESLKAWGIDPPKGIMFHGPPGTGKTLLAKALASELSSKTMAKKVSFFYQKGGECFGQWFGESEGKLRKLFRAAEANKPSIIFFDEIDGLCPEREKLSQSSQAYASIVTALLGLIDSVKRGDVFIIGATNRLDAVDPAIRRPGRFDKDLLFHLPDVEGRKHIIKIHTSKWPCDKPTGPLINHIADKTVGFTGADLKKLCCDTAIAAQIRCGDAKVLNVLSKDWNTAFCGMNRSTSNAFGSTLLISQPTMAKIRPLVVNIAKEIIDKIIPLIPNKDAWVKNICGCNSLLVWEPDNDSADYFHQIIMKDVLSDPLINKITTYILDTESILKRVSTGNTVIEATGKIINQMTISGKPSILYIPQIDLLHTAVLNLTKEKYDSSFINQLKKIPAANVLLLATHTGHMQNLSPSIKKFFLTIDRSVRKPNAIERKNFFGPIFMDLIDQPKKLMKTNRAKKQKIVEDKFQQQWDRAVEISEDDQVDFLFKLYDTLQSKKVELIDSDTGTNDKLLLESGFDRIFQLYEENRLIS